MFKMAENKHQFTNICNNRALNHNIVEVLNDNLFGTFQGTDAHMRIGDKVYGRYIQIKMYFENQQYRPKAAYLVLVLRNKSNPQNPITDGENIFEPITTSKNLDYIDYNKYQVLYSKRVIVNDSGSTTGTNAVMNTNPAGVFPDGTAAFGSSVIGNPTRYHTFKVWLNKNINYLEGGSSLPVTQRYSLAIIPYATYTTNTDNAVYPVGHVSAVSKFYFKDV